MNAQEIEKLKPNSIFEIISEDFFLKKIYQMIISIVKNIMNIIMLYLNTINLLAY